MDSGGKKQTIGTLACAWVFLPLVLMFPAGCGVSPWDGVSGDVTDGPAGTGHGPADIPDSDDPVASTIVGDGPFDSHIALTPAENTTETVEGDISSGSAVGVFDIGPVAAGDRLVITADAVGSLDPVLALFDADGSAMIVNDDRNYYGGDLDSAIDMRSRRDTSHCYVAVAASHGSGTTGAYVLKIRRVWEGVPAEPEPQLVYLNFDGADAVVIGRRTPVRIPEFEGSLIGAEFADRSELLLEETVARIRKDYTGLNVEFVSSREGPKPAAPHTTIHFGAYDAGLLGIADYVDEFNLAAVQKAIIFVDTFGAFLPLNPSVEEMADALSNVASHETGHLLGLNHTRDARSIMDISANLRQMLASQAFRRSPFHEQVFPVGYQDAARLLVEAVGGDLSLVKAAAAEQLTMRAAWYDQGEPVPARLDRPFSTCGCPSCAKHRRTHKPQSTAGSTLEPG